MFRAFNAQYDATCVEKLGDDQWMCFHTQYPSPSVPSFPPYPFFIYCIFVLIGDHILMDLPGDNGVLC